MRTAGWRRCPHLAGQLLTNLLASSAGHVPQGSDDTLLICAHESERVYAGGRPDSAGPPGLLPLALYALVALVQEFLPHMIEQRDGAIVSAARSSQTWRATVTICRQDRPVTACAPVAGKWRLVRAGRIDGWC